MPDSYEEAKALTHRCLQYLAGQCDGARRQDGHGFSAYDAEFGSSLASKDPSTWTLKMAIAGRKVARKYRQQLAAGLGIDFDSAVPEIQPPREVIVESRGSIEMTGGRGHAVIRFPYSERLIEAVRELPGRKWHPAPKRYWMVPLNADTTEAVIDFADRFGLILDESLRDLATRIASQPRRRIELSDEKDRLLIYFPIREKLIEHEVRAIPGRSFASSHWEVPLMFGGPALAMAERHDFAVDPEIAPLVEREERRITNSLAASSAQSSDFHVEGLGGTPRPFQRAGIEYAVEKRRAWIADEMGLGKSFEALATIQALGAFPAVVVCPASLKANWKREARKFLPSRTARVLSGSKAAALDLMRADIYIINYDVLHGWVDNFHREAIQAVVLDESHFCKNAKAKRTKAARHLATWPSVESILLLTGTPIMNRPEELMPQLEIMGRMDDFGGRKEFRDRYVFGQRLDELNIMLRSTCMVRRLKRDVLKELPAKVRAFVPMDLDNVAEYRRVESDVIRWIGDQAERDKSLQGEAGEWAASTVDQLLASGELDASMTRAEHVAKLASKRLSEIRGEREDRARRAETLVRIEKLKQVAVRGKMRSAFEWIDTFLSSGEKLVVFATHRETVDSIAERYAAPKIDGSTPVDSRQGIVDRFQRDDGCRLVVGNLNAMGVGLTLTAASNVCFLEFGWTPAAHDQAEDRLHRIGQESDSVTAWYLSADGTIDETIWALIEEKRQVVDAAVGTVAAQQPEADSSVFADLVAELGSRAG